jgi:hypothetical protein
MDARYPVGPTLLALLPALLLFGEGARGQSPKAAAGGPTLAPPAPYGIQRGTELELALTGTGLADPVGLWTSFPATVTIPADGGNGKDDKQLRVRLRVPPDAPLGYGALRLSTARGVSNLRLFCIDDLPQVLQADSCRTKATPQPVPVPCVVAGRTEPEKSDYYQVTVKPGERVSFEVIGRRLGGPLDPQISLIDPRTHKELAYSNDAPGLQTDARLTHTFAEGGTYLLEVRDMQGRGGADYGYRLRIGDFPCATTPLPMAVRRGTTVRVSFAGPCAADAAPVAVAMPADAEAVWVTPRFANGLAGWPVCLAASDVDEILEHEPNDDPAHANRVPIPVGITGRFQAKNDIDHFVFAAKKGDRLGIQAHTHELGSPTEVLLTLKDAQGKQVAASDPQGEPRIDFTAPGDGDYTLAVESPLFGSGPDETYRITIAPPEPAFEVVLGADRFELPPGGWARVPIQSILRHNYDGPVEIRVAGPPGIRGRTSLPAAKIGSRPPPAAAPADAGAAAAGSEATPAPGAADHSLYLTADPGLAPGPYPVTIEATGVRKGKPVVVRASVRPAVARDLGNLAFPPRDLLHQALVAVTEQPPFTLSFRFDRAEFLRGSPAGFTVRAVRQPGFTDEISLNAVALPPNVAAELGNIPRGRDEVTGRLNPGAEAPLGRFRVSMTGKARFQDREYTVLAPPAELVLGPPFELTVRPAPLRVGAGAKARLTVTATRRLGYEGSIELELRNLPKDVTAAKSMLAAGQTEAEIELTAADAAAGESNDARVVGTAAAAPNQQHASADFTVRVRRKFMPPRWFPIAGP